MTRRKESGAGRQGEMSLSDHIFEKLATQTLRVQHGGKSIEMQATEAVANKQFQTAMSGSPHAQRQYLENIRRAEAARQQLIEDRVAFGLKLKAYQQAVYARHQRDHGTDPAIYPHPDDIVIDRRNGFKVVGPWDEDSQREMERARVEIDAFLLQDALDRARATPSRRRDPSIERGDSVSLAMVLNETLPPRLRLSSDDFLKVRMELAHRPKRDLLRRTRAAWASAGRKMRRGADVLEPKIGAAVIDLLTDVERIRREGLSEAEREDRIAEAVFRRLG